VSAPVRSSWSSPSSGGKASSSGREPNGPGRVALEKLRSGSTLGDLLGEKLRAVQPVASPTGSQGCEPVAAPAPARQALRWTGAQEDGDVTYPELDPREVRFCDGQYERCVGGAWAEWSALRLDRIGVEAAARDVALARSCMPRPAPPMPAPPMSEARTHFVRLGVIVPADPTSLDLGRNREELLRGWGPRRGSCGGSVRQPPPSA
jgi:hypothetical protein